MSTNNVKIDNYDISFDNTKPFVLLGGINVLESRDLAMSTAEFYKTETDKRNIPYVFKASFDKANRSSIQSFRGPGLDEGLKILQEVKETFNLPIISDIHEPHQAKSASEVCDILQLPAFLSRQTDLVVEMAKTNKVIHIKKAQFLAPHEMRHIIKKCNDVGNNKVMLCERGSAFGYNNLIVDMLAFLEMKKHNVPVTFDVTHALQLPGAGKDAAAGRGEYTVDFAGAGLAMGISALFLEAHPDPKSAKCDGPSALKLSDLPKLLDRCVAIDKTIKGY